MQIWRLFAALPIAVFAGEALAENWITVNTDSDGFSTSVDKDSIRRGSDGLVYYTDDHGYTGKEDLAADCQRRVFYTINHHNKGGKVDFPNWRHESQPASLDARAEAEFQYVCANAG